MGTAPITLSEAEIRAQLTRIIGGTVFAGAKRVCALLSYLVDASLAGRAGGLKEYQIATEALGRNDSFDPRFDPIARVEASRLRARLEHYYATEGAADPIVIALPKGAYVPRIEKRERPVAVSPQTIAPRTGRWTWLIAAAAGGIAAGLGVAFWASTASPSNQAPVMRSEAVLGAPGELSHQAGSAIAISPDGKSLAMLVRKSDGAPHLFVRAMDSLEAVELPGTAGADAPFFSPDSKWVAFNADAKLKKALADGSGSPILLGDVSDFLGGAWLETGDIVLASARRNMFWRLSENGGQLQALKDYGGEAQSLAAPRWEEPLPAGRGILFTSNREDGYAIEFVKADGTGRKVVLRHGFYPRYAASGHLLYVDNGTLYAVKFDVARAETVGAPWAVVKDVAFSESFGCADYDISDNGTLVYWRQPGAGASVLSRITPEGSTPLIEQPARYAFPRISPDGRRVAFAVGMVDTSDMYIYDISTRARIRVESSSHALTFPLWSPDGRYLLATDQTAMGIVARNGDGSGADRMMLSGIIVPFSMTQDGKRLAYYKMGENTVFDLWTAPFAGGPDGPEVGKEEVFRATPFVETYPVFSPDGRWIAYASNEGGGFEVYVRAFPDTKSRVVKVSSSGGRVPYFAGNRIFYSSNDHRIMSAEWRVKDGRFEADMPNLWSTASLADTGVLPGYSMSADGRTVIGLTPSNADAPHDRVVIVQNFFEELRRGPKA